MSAAGKGDSSPRSGPGSRWLDDVARVARKLNVVAAWADATAEELKQPAFQSDPDFIAKLLPFMEAFNRYFDAEVRGMDRLPESGPMLLVGNHSGGVLTPDTSALIAAWYAERGLDSPLVGLAMDAVFGIPGFKQLMRKIGQIPANHDNAARALEQGAAVLVYPGGAHEVFRPWAARNRIDFGGHRGFVRLALRSQVPVVPVVGHGGHDTLMVLARGEAIARRMGFDRIRLSALPVILQFPWGITTPAFVGLPMPAKINLQVCEPIDWSHLGPEAADDEATVARCCREVTDLMQATLDELAAENPSPVATRLRKLLGIRSKS